MIKSKKFINCVDLVDFMANGLIKAIFFKILKDFHFFAKK